MAMVASKCGTMDTVAEWRMDTAIAAGIAIRVAGLRAHTVAAADGTEAVELGRLITTRTAIRTRTATTMARAATVIITSTMDKVAAVVVASAGSKYCLFL